MNLLDYMKRTILLVVCFALFGFGCMRSSVPLQLTSVQTGWNTYVNVDYRFSFDYPSGMEMRSRPSEQQATEYMDLPGKFFASLRDVTREDQPVSIAYFYAMDGKTIDQFLEALKASDSQNVLIKETVDMEKGKIQMKKVVSTTALGVDKVHYLFVDGTTLVVISQFMNENVAFEPIIQTVRGQ